MAVAPRSPQRTESQATPAFKPTFSTKSADSGHSRSNSARSLAPQPEGRPGEQITLDDVEHIAI
jgi:hypothetical protein